MSGVLSHANRAVSRPNTSIAHYVRYVNYVIGLSLGLGQTRHCDRHLSLIPHRLIAIPDLEIYLMLTWTYPLTRAGLMHYAREEGGVRGAPDRVTSVTGVAH